MFFGKSFLLFLYNELKNLYSGADIEAQGGTQFVSELKYFLAMDYFKKQRNCSCDTKVKEHKDLFIKAVGRTVFLSDVNESLILSTKNFSKSYGVSKDYDVGSNFFSVNTVKNSITSQEPLKFPSRHPQLLTISKGIIDIYSEAYKNISEKNDYLSGSKYKFAVLFIWLSRFLDFKSINSFYDEALSQLETDFSHELINCFEWKNIDLKEIINNFIKSAEIVKDKQFIMEDDLKNIYQIDNTYIKTTNQISHPHNRIIFGAPGTGKSHKLENESSLFVDTTTTEIDDNEFMKQEIYALGSDRSNSFAIGIKYFDKLKDKKIRDLQTEYNCNRHSAYAIYQAIRVCEKIGQLPDFGDEISDEKVKQELDELLKIKYMNQAGAAAIGFKYSDHLDGRTISELKEDFSFGEGGSLAHWMYYGVQAANYQFDKFEAKSIKKIERVTFHPNYSYAQFVGTYKPVQDKNDNEKILYSYIPGPFMRIYVNAKRNPEKNFLLLIEEINRANVAAVFGDVFQLLDRKSDGTSQYPIAASEDQKNYLESCGINDDEISIPSNMYIWATMNSADQGVQPMDAAFKRRWDFEYIGIDDNEESVKDYVLPIPQKNSDGNIFYTSENWNKIRKDINNKLKNIYGVNEDKLLGPYFLSKSTLDEAKQINFESETDKAEKICSLFKSKVLMYLYEDVVKMNPTELFSKSEFESDKPLHYSYLCNKFDEVGLKIFGEEFVK